MAMSYIDHCKTPSAHEALLPDVQARASTSLSRGAAAAARYTEHVLAQTRAQAAREGARAVQQAFLKEAARQLADSARAEAARAQTELQAAAIQGRQRVLHQSLSQMRATRQAQEAWEQARREPQLQAGTRPSLMHCL